VIVDRSRIFAAAVAACGLAAAPADARLAVRGAYGMTAPTGRARAHVYVGSGGNQTVTVYADGVDNPKVLASYFNGSVEPTGVAVDPHGRIYIAGDQYVVEFQPGARTPYRVLTDGLSSAFTDALDSQSTLYVEDQINGIVEFPLGASKPSRTINTKGVVGYGYVAVDHKDNLYVANSSDVYEIPKGTPTVKPLRLGGLVSPAGIAFDTHDLMYISNPGGIYVYRLGKRDPIRVILTSFFPGGLSFDPSGLMYVVDDNEDTVYIFGPHDSPFGSVTQGLYGAESVTVGV
jgi:DNA-binding beta-propeller fold protein YncE